MQIDQKDIERILSEARNLPGYGDCLFRKPYSLIFVGRGTSIRVDGQHRPMRVHQAIYLYYYGDIPPKAVIRHLCGYSGCCNYQHLYAGTQRDNCRDISFHQKYGRGVLAPKEYF